MKGDPGGILHGAGSQSSVTKRTTAGKRAIYVFIVALTVYAGTLGFGYVWDDFHLISRVQGAVKTGQISQLLTSSFFVKMAQSAHYYRPVMMVSLLGDVLLAGASPWFSHLVGMVIHAMNAVLVLLLLRRILMHEAGALAGALLFAVHPVHTEAVAAISSRMDLLTLLLLLPAVLYWTTDGESLPSNPARALALATLSYFLACLTKETALMLPAVLLSWEAIRWRRPGTEKLLGFASLFVTAGAVLFLRGLVFAREGAVGEALNVKAGAFLAGVEPGMVIKVLLVNMRLAVLPFPVRSHWAGTDLTLGWPTIIAALSFLGLLAWCFMRSPLNAASGLAWWAIFTLPVAGLFNLGQVVAAERYAYIPSVGICMMIGGLVASFPEPALSGRMVKALARAGIFALAVASVVHARPWSDEVTLFGRVVRTNPSYPTAFLNLGVALAAEGRHEDALAAYEKAEHLVPGWVQVAYNRGNLLFRSGKYDEALRDMESVLKSVPEDWEAALNRGNILVAMGRREEAAESYRLAASLSGSSGKPLVGLGVLAAREGRYEEARVLFQEAAEREPDLTEALEGLAETFLAMGMPDQAQKAFLRALEIDPGNARAAVKLGNLLMERHEPVYALFAFKSALAVDQSSVGGWVGFVLASEAAGEAPQAQRRLGELERENPDLALEIRRIMARLPASE